MRFLVFSDLHFFRGRPYLLDTCNWIAEQVFKHRPDTAVFCGDLNHSHNQVETDVLHDLAEAMSNIASVAKNNNIPFVAISGNHDTTLKSSGKNIVSALGRLCPAIQPVTEPTLLFGNLYAPHPPVEEEALKRYTDAIHTYAATATGIMFSHLELADIRYTPVASTCTEHPFVIPDSIRTVVNGHYHHPERRSVAGKDIVIVGAPCYHTYADLMVDDPRGIVLLDVDNRGAIKKLDRIENPHGPIFHTIEVSQIPALMGHPAVKRMRVRVKLDSKDALAEHRGSIMRLREVADSVRVLGTTSEAAMQIYRAETTTLSSIDPVSMFQGYVAKKSITKARADVGLSLLQGAVK